ncbi:MAG: 2Fe-2S iron-sulfur cluster-binding protein [Rhodospirillales bacterium]
MTDITVEFRRSGVTGTWDGSHENILELAESLDLVLAYSCRSGICTTCQCAKIAGEIEYTDDGVFEPDAENEILICCSVPKTPLVLDI